jgi:AcrR family transcriptional regulator
MVTSPEAHRHVGRPRTFTDEDIFAGVSRVLSNLGYTRLTIASLADEVGCTGPALIKRFGSRRDLLSAYLHWANESSRERFNDARRKHTSPIAALRSRFEQPVSERLDEVADPAGFAYLIGFLLSASNEPTLVPVLKQRYEVFHQEISSLIEDAVEAGELRDVDTNRLGRTLLEALIGAALLWDYSSSWVADGHEQPVEHRLGEVVLEVLQPYLRGK